MARDIKMTDGLLSGLIEGEHYDHSLPDHRLIAAIIQKAVRDYLFPDTWDLSDKTKLANKEHQLEERNKMWRLSAHNKWSVRAAEWLTSDDGPEVEGSFNFYLQLLTANPQALRTKILAKCGLLH